MTVGNSFLYRTVQVRNKKLRSQSATSRPSSRYGWFLCLRRLLCFLGCSQVITLSPETNDVVFQNALAPYRGGWVHVFSKQQVASSSGHDQLLERSLIYLASIVPRVSLLPRRPFIPLLIDVDKLYRQDATPPSRSVYHRSNILL